MANSLIQIFFPNPNNDPGKLGWVGIEIPCSLKNLAAHYFKDSVLVIFYNDFNQVFNSSMVANEAITESLEKKKVKL